MIGEDINPESPQEYEALKAAQHLYWLWEETYRAIVEGEEDFLQVRKRLEQEKRAST